MKSEILIIKNIAREGPGLLEMELKNFNTGYSVVDMSESQDFPPIENYRAVIVLGGPESANDSTGKMKNAIAFVKEVLTAGIPYLGICLGMQILIKAAGGKVIKCPNKEVGFIDPEGNNFTLELTEKGRKDPLFAGLTNKFKVFHLHGETVKLTGDMLLLATGQHCYNQIVKTGRNAYGIQSHFELTPQMLETWINEDPDLMRLDEIHLKASFKEIENEYTKTGLQLFKNFLTLAFGN